MLPDIGVNIFLDVGAAAISFPYRFDPTPAVTPDRPFYNSRVSVSVDRQTLCNWKKQIDGF